MHQPNQLEEKAPRPAGLLPKNVQSWLLIGLAVLMVLIMWLTGGKKPTVPAQTLPPAPAVQAPLEVNEAKIVDLQNRIQELQREQIVAQNALTQQSRSLGPGNQEPPSATVPGSSANPGPERVEDPIRAEQKKRDYLSLFASNLALSYRKNPQTQQPREGEATPFPSTTPVPDPGAAQLADL